MRKTILSVAAVGALAAGVAIAPKKTSQQKDPGLWRPCPQTHRNEGKTFYADLERHSRPAALTGNHTIDAQVMSRLINQATGGFYVGFDKIAVLPILPVDKTVVAESVPASLRGIRFGTLDSHDHDARNLLGDWVAYGNAAKVAIENKERQDPAAHVEFTGYALALSVALEKVDPEFRKYPRFQEFVLWNLHRTWRIAEIAGTTDLFKNLRDNPDCQPIRDHLEKYYEGLLLD